MQTLYESKPKVAAIATVSKVNVIERGTKGAELVARCAAVFLA